MFVILIVYFLYIIQLQQMYEMFYIVIENISQICLAVLLIGSFPAVLNKSNFIKKTLMYLTCTIPKLNAILDNYI